MTNELLSPCAGAGLRQPGEVLHCQPRPLIPIARPACLAIRYALLVAAPVVLPLRRKLPLMVTFVPVS